VFFCLFYFLNREFIAEYSFWKTFFTKWQKFATKKSLYWTLAPKPNFLNNKFIVSQFWHGLKILYHQLQVGRYMVFSTLACFMDFCLVTHITISFAQTIHLNIVITTCYGFPSSSHIGICELNTPRLVNPSFFFSHLVGEGLCETIVSNNWIMIFFRCSYYQFACLSNTLDTNFPNFKKYLLIMHKGRLLQYFIFWNPPKIVSK
jgi:hypothetical protein